MFIGELIKILISYKYEGVGVLRFNHRTKYLIINESLGKDILIDSVKKALDKGTELVQYAIDKPVREMMDEATEIKKLCAKYRAIFIVKGRTDIAIAINGDGVHLEINDMDISDVRNLVGSNKIVGLSVNNEEELFQAREGGFDYITLGEDFHCTVDCKEIFKGNIYGCYHSCLKSDFECMKDRITGVYLTLEELSYNDVNDCIRELKLN